MTLGEWFTRWDANLQPIIVDRSTLATAGLGPRSRVMPPLPSPGQPGASRAVLRPLGLTVVPLGGSLLITTLSETPEHPGGPLERPETRNAWDLALRQASAWGSDVSERFQSVARWRGEATPKNAGPDDAWEREPLSGVWRTWRFAASDWPGPGASVHLIDQRAQGTAAATLGLAILGIAFIARNWPRRRRAIGLSLVVAVSLVVFARGGESAASLAGGAVLGAWAALLFWLGRRLPWPRSARTRRRDPGRRPGSTQERRLGGPVVRACWIIGLVLAVRAALGQSVETVRILALLPYEGVPDLNRQPDRAILRLGDYERLQAWAQSSAAPAVPTLTASTASQRVLWPNQGDVLVESAFTLGLRGGPSAAWSLPIENARDLSATLDGAPAPLGVDPGGLLGSIFVSGSGPHTLLVRRRVSVRPDEHGEVCVLPVNSVATARILVEGEAGGPAIEVPSARGGLEAKGKSVEGWLGPADRVERCAEPCPTPRVGPPWRRPSRASCSGMRSRPGTVCGRAWPCGTPRAPRSSGSRRSPASPSAPAPCRVAWTSIGKGPPRSRNGSPASNPRSPTGRPSPWNSGGPSPRWKGRDATPCSAPCRAWTHSRSAAPPECWPFAGRRTGRGGSRRGRGSSRSPMRRSSSSGVRSPMTR